MYSLVLLILCASALASTVPMDSKPYYNLEDAESLFEDFLETYERFYLDDNEKGKRFEIFKKSLEEINRLNADPNETAYFDLEQEEFKKMYTGFIAKHNRSMMNVTLPVSPVHIELLDGFDWRERGVVTRVKNQASCGSCWAFATTGTLEGAYAIKHGQLLEFSEQQLVDCDTYGHGCQGGFIDGALEYLQQAGAETEDAYPYVGIQYDCMYDQRKVKALVTGVIPADMQSEDVLAQQLQSTGPIGIVLDGGSSRFKYYGGGVLLNCPSSELDHAVLLVGYGTAELPFWIIKNSWTDSWGENGYIRVQRGVNACGMVNQEAFIAQVA